MNARKLKSIVALLAAAWLALGRPTAYGQMMPGMEPAGNKPAPTAGAEQTSAGPKAQAGQPAKPKSLQEQKESLAQRIEEEGLSGFRKFYFTYLSQDSPYRGVFLAILTVVILLFVRRQSTKVLRAYAQSRAQRTENVDRFMRTVNLVWKFVIAVFVIIAMSGSLKLMGLSAAFLGMMLGWSLQAPVTGIAAWLMILLKRPFRIGDRVIIAGIIGDVMDITLTHVILNQVGGTIGGEERSGRAVLIPNAILFGNIIMNYTLQEKYTLDEVPVRLTFDSDWELAQQIMVAAAQQACADIIEETGQKPFIRCEFFDAGVLVRLRYQTIASKRQEISSAIVEKVLSEFKANYPKVKFCYPRSVVRYRWEDEEAIRASLADPSSPA